MEDAPGNSEFLNPKEGNAVDAVMAITEDAVLSGEAFPEQKIRDTLIEMGRDVHYIEMVLIVARISFDGDMEVREGRYW